MTEKIIGMRDKTHALFAKAQTKCMMRLAKVKDNSRKWEPGDHLLEVLGTIIIAVVILILFRGAILEILPMRFPAQRPAC